MASEAKQKVYRCPNKCGRPGYPRPTWKTQAGFDRHTSACPKSPSAIAVREQQERERLAKAAQVSEVAIASAAHKVGEVIHFVSIHVVKPTHVLKWGRMARVRYEEVRSYSGRTETINSVGFNGYCAVYNYRIADSDICESIEIARSTAAARQAAYDAQCQQAADCR